MTLNFMTDRIVPAVPEEQLYELEALARAWCKEHGAVLQATGRCDRSPYQPAVFARVSFYEDRFFTASAPSPKLVIDDLSRLGLLFRECQQQDDEATP